MSAGAAGSAAGAAAARARMLREEEESMTGYTPEELAEGWEFKFLRSVTSRFKDPEVLRRCLEEEGRAGWTLVEKFDNSRVRLKRPAAARRGDASLKSDPYRTWVGMTEGQFGMMIAGIGLGAVALILLVVFAATR